MKEEEKAEERRKESACVAKGPEVTQEAIGILASSSARHFRRFKPDTSPGGYRRAVCLHHAFHFALGVHGTHPACLYFFNQLQ